MKYIMKFVLLNMLLVLCFGCEEKEPDEVPQENPPGKTAHECESAKNKLLEAEAKYKKTEEEYYKISVVKDLAKEEYEKAFSDSSQASVNCRKANEEAVVLSKKA